MLTCDGNENCKKQNNNNRSKLANLAFRPIGGGGVYNKVLYWEPLP